MTRIDLARRLEDKIIAIERARNLPQAEAEREAFETILAEFLNENLAATPSHACAHCGRPEAQGSPLLPIGTDATGHAWVHDRCWAPWREARRKAAVEALAAMGVAEPGPGRR